MKQRAICCLGYSRARSTHRVLLPAKRKAALRPVEVLWMAAVLDCAIVTRRECGPPLRAHDLPVVTLLEFPTEHNFSMRSLHHFSVSIRSRICCGKVSNFCTPVFLDLGSCLRYAYTYPHHCCLQHRGNNNGHGVLSTPVGYPATQSLVPCLATTRTICSPKSALPLSFS